ncbi:MAG: hypothetical protein AAB353_05575 [Candidatus Hydrogenedentota bacterium]
MRHLDDHTLEEFVLGSLGADHQKLITVHLRVCMKCRALAEKSREEIARVKAVLTLARESRRSDCPSNEILALFSDRGIDGAEFEEVENHLAQCSDCRVTLQAIRHELTMVRSPSETDWAELERTIVAGPRAAVSRPSEPSVLRYYDFAFARRYVSVLLMAAILVIGGLGPERFRPHWIVVSVIVALVPVLRDRYLFKSGPISIGRCLMYSPPAVGFLAAWVFPTHAYWCLAFALIGGGLVLLSVPSASEVENAAAARHPANGESSVRKPNVDRITK